MLNAMTAAYSQMLRLIESGFVVLNIRIGARNPVLVVQNNAAVTRLKGASAVRRTGPVGIERVMIARCGQCQIEWIERGN